MKRSGDDQKFIAEVLAIGIECDLALLTVNDDKFWSEAKLLKLGDLPKLKVRSKPPGHMPSPVRASLREAWLKGRYHPFRHLLYRAVLAEQMPRFHWIKTCTIHPR